VATGCAADLSHLVSQPLDAGDNRVAATRTKLTFRVAGLPCVIDTGRHGWRLTYASLSVAEDPDLVDAIVAACGGRVGRPQAERIETRRLRCLVCTHDGRLRVRSRDRSTPRIEPEEVTV